VINAQDCYNGYSPATVARIRNQLFTAITRSKAWVRVLGVGPMMDSLIEEYKEIARRKFRLEFTYPDEKARNHLRIISRDISRRSPRRARDIAELKELLEAIAAGEVEIEDLPAQTRRRLGNLFRSQQ
jgi:superfamily I DNA and RNA helicase